VSKKCPVIYSLKKQQWANLDFVQKIVICATCPFTADIWIPAASFPV